MIPMVALTVACGAAAGSNDADVPGPSEATPTTSDTTPTVAVAKAQESTPVLATDGVPAACDAAWERIATAVELHYAETGFDVVTIEELTPRYLPRNLTDWTIEETPGESPIVVGESGERCDGYTGDVGRIPPQSIPPERQNPESGTGVECFVQQPILLVAVYAYNAENGAFPASQDALVAAELIPFEFDLYDINGPGSVTKTFDGDCFGRSEELPAPFDEYNSLCFADALRLQAAMEAHRILNGFYVESLDALIESEYLFGVVANYSIGAAGDLFARDSTFCPGPIRHLDERDSDCHTGVNASGDLCLRVGE